MLHVAIVYIANYVATCTDSEFANSSTIAPIATYILFTTINASFIHTHTSSYMHGVSYVGNNYYKLVKIV